MTEDQRKLFGINLKDKFNEYEWTKYITVVKYCRFPTKLKVMVLNKHTNKRVPELEQDFVEGTENIANRYARRLR